MKTLETSRHMVDFMSCITQSQAYNGAKALFLGSPEEAVTISTVASFWKPFLITALLAFWGFVSLSNTHRIVHTDRSFCNDSQATFQAQCFSYPWYLFSRYLWNWIDFIGECFVSPDRTEIPWEVGTDFPICQTTSHYPKQPAWALHPQVLYEYCLVNPILMHQKSIHTGPFPFSLSGDWGLAWFPKPCNRNTQTFSTRTSLTNQKKMDSSAPWYPDSYIKPILISTVRAFTLMFLKIL